VLNASPSSAYSTLPSPYALQQGMQPRSRAPIYCFYQLESNHRCWIISITFFKTALAIAGFLGSTVQSVGGHGADLFNISTFGKVISCHQDNPRGRREHYVSDSCQPECLAKQVKSLRSMALDALSQANLRARQGGRKAIEHH